MSLDGRIWKVIETILRTLYWCSDCGWRCGTSVREGVPNTRLITCRSSKEHRDLNGIGDCKGSKYACTCFKSDAPLRRGKLSAECSEPPTFWKPLPCLIYRRSEGRWRGPHTARGTAAFQIARSGKEKREYVRSVKVEKYSYKISATGYCQDGITCWQHPDVIADITLIKNILDTESMAFEGFFRTFHGTHQSVYHLNHFSAMWEIARFAMVCDLYGDVMHGQVLLLHSIPLFCLSTLWCGALWWLVDIGIGYPKV